MAIKKALGITALVALSAAAGLAVPISPVARAQMQPTGSMGRATTALYQVQVDIEPAQVMLTPDQAQGATMGEVMASMPMSDATMMGGSSMLRSMATGGSASMMPSSMGMNESGMSNSASAMTMATSDDGQPVNHHLEVQVLSNATGSPATDVMPQISITNVATGQTRMLNDVMPMYDIQVGPSDLHYGNNVYLADGTPYTVTVTIGSDVAQFSNLMVSGGMGLPADSMGMMGDQGSMQPMTGP